jgi:hypothetical protein
MSMPEATMYKHHGSQPWQHDIGSPRKICNVKAVTKSCREKKLSYRKFRLCILAANAGHHPASRFPVDNVDH